MTIDGILLKKQCMLLFYAKILHYNFTPIIYENFKLVFLLIQGKQKFGNLHSYLVCAIE